jgi:hypothetical protein
VDLDDDDDSNSDRDDDFVKLIAEGKSKLNSSTSSPIIHYTSARTQHKVWRADGMETTRQSYRASKPSVPEKLEADKNHVARARKLFPDRKFDPTDIIYRTSLSREVDLFDKETQERRLQMQAYSGQAFRIVPLTMIFGNQHFGSNISYPKQVVFEERGNLRLMEYTQSADGRALYSITGELLILSKDIQSFL